MSPTLAIFDLDGTLIDSVGDLHRAVNLLLAEHGCEPLSLPQVRSMVGDGATQLVKRALAARSCPVTDLRMEVQRFLELYAVDPVALTCSYPGVSATLQALQDRGITLAVATNKPIGVTEVILARLHLAHFFTMVLGGDSRPYRKPDPRILEELLQRFAVLPAQAVLVGDSEVDAATAQAADVPFVLMTYGYHRGAVEAIPCRAAVDNFAQLADLIQAL